MAHVQGEGSPSASVAFLSDIPPDILTAALAIRFDRSDLFCSHLTSGDDWEEVEMELNLIDPFTIVTVGETAMRLVLGDRALTEIHGEPLRVGDFIVIPIHAPRPPPWHIRFACDLQTLHGYLYPKPDPVLVPVAPPVKLKPRKPRPQARLWQDGDLP